MFAGYSGTHRHHPASVIPRYVECEYGASTICTWQKSISFGIRKTTTISGWAVIPPRPAKYGLRIFTQVLDGDPGAGDRLSERSVKHLRGDVHGWAPASQHNAGSPPVPPLPARMLAVQPPQFRSWAHVPGCAAVTRWLLFYRLRDRLLVRYRHDDIRYSL